MNDKIKAMPSEVPDIEFNFTAQESFVQEKGVLLAHYVAIPSPIGLKDRGDYRRPDSLDFIESNGFLYKKVGEFMGIIVNNTKNHTNQDAGIYDASVARLILPKFYTNHCNSQKPEIALLPGDRIHPQNIELRVDNYQRAQYNEFGTDYLQFPAKCVSFLIDSRNEEYTQDVHYNITPDGNIKWIDGQKNPGIDPETGKGRVYSIRYTYLAFWYILQLINEIRITNEGTAELPVRLPYHAAIQREYVYHNKIRSDTKNQTLDKVDSRTQEKPKQGVNSGFDLKVDISQFE